MKRAAREQIRRLVRRALPCLLGGAALWCSNVAAETADLPALSAKATPAVVLLTCSGTRESSGTGFFVSESGRIVTNHHVAVDCSEMTATTSDKRVFEIDSVVAWDADADIAILQTRSGTFPALAFGDAARTRVGEDIAIVGSPLGLSATLSVGIISAIRSDGLTHESFGQRNEAAKDKTGSWGLQFSAPISPGSSGSPVLNVRGEVIGVAVGNVTGGQGLNFGIPCSVPVRMLAALGEHAVPVRALHDRSTARKRNLAISGALIVAIAVIAFAGSKIAERRALSRGKGRRRQD
jgi:S1-C subfamily serine protease